MKARLTRYALIFAILAVCGYVFFTWRGPAGVRALSEKETRIKELEERNAALAKEIERKREHIRRLSENPAEQELEVRDRLKLVHPNEKVYIIGEPEKEKEKKDPGKTVSPESEPRSGR
jgi:cell division protein FtsB